MDETRRDGNPANPNGMDDPLQRIAALERRVAVLTRENERLETFLAVLRHRIFGRSSEKMSPDQLSLLDTETPIPADPGEADPLRTRSDSAGAVAGAGAHCRILCRG
jgi:transposase